MTSCYLSSIIVLLIGACFPGICTIQGRPYYYDGYDTDSDSAPLSPAERAIVRTVTHSKNLVSPNGVTRPIGQQSKSTVLPTAGQTTGGWLGQGRLPDNRNDLGNTGLGYNNLVRPGFTYGLGNLGYNVAGQGTRDFDNDGDGDSAEHAMAGQDVAGDEGDVIIRLPNRVLYHLIRRFGVRENEMENSSKKIWTGRSSSRRSRRLIRRLIRQLMRASTKSAFSDSDGI